jgi:hypothetical protein
MPRVQLPRGTRRMDTLRIMPAVTFVDVAALNRAACEFLSILDDLAQSVTVIGIAGQSPGMQHELPARGAGVGGDDCLSIIDVFSARFRYFVQDKPNYVRSRKMVVTFLDLRNFGRTHSRNQQHAIHLRQDRDNIVAYQQWR